MNKRLVTQEDLIELQYLQRKKAEATQAYEKLRDEIAAAMAQGAQIEDGLLTARRVEEIEVA